MVSFNLCKNPENSVKFPVLQMKKMDLRELSHTVQAFTATRLGLDPGIIEKSSLLSPLIYLSHLCDDLGYLLGERSRIWLKQSVKGMKCLAIKLL